MGIMLRCIARSFQKNWYKKALTIPFWIWVPLAFVFQAVSFFRRLFYRKGWLTAQEASLPVIVVGNITVGGSGKTPVVIYLAELLRKRGLRPGIVSRGHQGTATRVPGAFWVTERSDPLEVGDEPVLMARRLGCPVAVARRRMQAVNLLVQSGQVDVILSDDGLQHYGMARCIEIAVISSRGVGNGWCLPAGPLREPVSRLREVDLIVTQEQENVRIKAEEPQTPYYRMTLKPTLIYPASGVGDPQTTEAFSKEKPVHAIAGIGYPDQFFQQLILCGFQVIPHPYPDHHQFLPEEVIFKDELPVLMTEKDWVKCAAFVKKNHWVFMVNAELEAGFEQQLLGLLEKSAGQKGKIKN